MQIAKTLESALLYGETKTFVNSDVRIGPRYSRNGIKPGDLINSDWPRNGKSPIRSRLIRSSQQQVQRILPERYRVGGNKTLPGRRYGPCQRLAWNLL